MRADEVEALLEAPLKKLPLPSRRGPDDGPLQESNNHNSIDAVKEGHGAGNAPPSERNEHCDGRGMTTVRSDPPIDSKDDVCNPHHCSLSPGHGRRDARRERSISRERVSYHKSASREPSHHHRRHRHHDHDRHHRRHRSPSYSRSRSPARHRPDHHQPPNHVSSRPLPTYSPPRSAPTSNTIITAPNTSNNPPSTVSADKRTVFVRQIGQRVGEGEVRRVCEQAGRVLSVRLVLDRHTRRHKGVAYVEYECEESIPKALALTGTRLANVPLIFEVSDAEKNRIAAEAALQQRKMKLVEEQQKALLCRVRIEQLHPGATEEDIKRFFAGCGHISKLAVGKEVAEVDFKNATDAKRAAESLDRHVLLSRQVRLILTSIDQSVIPSPRPPTDSNNNALEGDEFLSVTPQKRAELMLKLARSASVANKTVVLGNVGCDDNPEEVLQEIKAECSKYGAITDIHLEARHETVSVKFETSEQASEAQSALDGRWFSGRRIHAKVQ